MDYDNQIAAATIFMEAAGEPQVGKLAVAYVLLNRLTKRRYGRTLAQVCLAPLQFSSWNTSEPTRMLLAGLPDNDPVLASCVQALTDAQRGSPGDPTGGATLYYADYMKTPPAWAARAVFTIQIGRHRFYRDT